MENGESDFVFSGFSKGCYYYPKWTDKPRTRTKTVKLTTQQHLFQLSRNAVVQLAYMCVLW